MGFRSSGLIPFIMAVENVEITMLNIIPTTNMKLWLYLPAIETNKYDISKENTKYIDVETQGLRSKTSLNQIALALNTIAYISKFEDWKPSNPGSEKSFLIISLEM
jgi:hypothetical protein